jgi:hypothetical protein
VCHLMAVDAAPLDHGGAQLTSSNHPKRPRRNSQLHNGFDCTFTKEPPEHLQIECSICLAILHESQIIDCHCGSSFCQSCTVPPSCSPVFQYKYSYFSVFCMHFQYFSVDFTKSSIYVICTKSPHFSVFFLILPVFMLRIQ